MLVSVARRGVWAMRADGTGLRRLELPCDGELAPTQASVALDGRTIAFRCDDRVIGLELASGRGQSWSTTRTSRATDDVPSWTPDGRRLVFMRVEGIGTRSESRRLLIRTLGIAPEVGTAPESGGEIVVDPRTSLGASLETSNGIPFHHVAVSGDGKSLLLTTTNALWIVALPFASDPDAGDVRSIVGDMVLTASELQVGTTAADDRVVLSLDCDGLPSIVQTPLEEIGTACTTGVRLVRGEGSLVAPARRADGLTAYVTASSGGVQVRTVREDDRAPRVILDTADVFDGATIDRIDFAPPDATIF